MSHCDSFCGFIKFGNSPWDLRPEVVSVRWWPRVALICSAMGIGLPGNRAGRFSPHLHDGIRPDGTTGKRRVQNVIAKTCCGFGVMSKSACKPSVCPSCATSVPREWKKGRPAHVALGIESSDEFIGRLSVLSSLNRYFLVAVLLLQSSSNRVAERPPNLVVMVSLFNGTNILRQKKRIS